MIFLRMLNLASMNSLKCVPLPDRVEVGRLSDWLQGLEVQVAIVEVQGQELLLLAPLGRAGVSVHRGVGVEVGPAIIRPPRGV